MLLCFQSTTLRYLRLYTAFHRIFLPRAELQPCLATSIGWLSTVRTLVKCVTPFFPNCLYSSLCVLSETVLSSRVSLACWSYAAADLLYIINCLFFLLLFFFFNFLPSTSFNFAAASLYLKFYLPPLFPLSPHLSF